MLQFTMCHVKLQSVQEEKSETGKKKKKGTQNEIDTCSPMFQLHAYCLFISKSFPEPHKFV